MDLLVTSYWFTDMTVTNTLLVKNAWPSVCLSSLCQVSCEFTFCKLFIYFILILYYAIYSFIYLFMVIYLFIYLFIYSDLFIYIFMVWHLFIRFIYLYFYLFIYLCYLFTYFLIYLLPYLFILNLRKHACVSMRCQ